jgi:hypothetical protein
MMQTKDKTLAVIVKRNCTKKYLSIFRLYEDKD